MSGGKKKKNRHAFWISEVFFPFLEKDGFNFSSFLQVTKLLLKSFLHRWKSDEEEDKNSSITRDDSILAPHLITNDGLLSPYCSLQRLLQFPDPLYTNGFHSFDGMKLKSLIHQFKCIHIGLRMRGSQMKTCISTSEHITERFFFFWDKSRHSLSTCIEQNGEYVQNDTSLWYHFFLNIWNRN